MRLLRLTGLLCAPIVLAGMVSPVRVAHAGPAPGAAGAASDEETLIGRGLELREKGDDEAALGAFRKAYDLKKGARALAQVALAEQALGRWVDAEAHLGQAVQRTDDHWIARNKPLLEPALAEIRGHLGSLELSGGVPGAEVRLNGEPAGAFPLKAPIRLVAGSVALEVRAAGYLPVVRTVNVPSRGLARESVVLIAAGPAAPPPALSTSGQATPDLAPAAAGNQSTAVAELSPALLSSPSSSPSSSSSPGTWGTRAKIGVGVGAAAVVGLGVGTAFLFLRESRAKDYNNSTAHCYTGDPNPSGTCKSLQDKEQSALTGAVVGLATAAVLGGVATFLFLTDQSGTPGSVALAGGARTVRCAPTAGFGLACAGAF